MADKAIKVGIIGLGRSGWDIHARTLQALPKLYQVVAVCDPDASRRGEAEQELGCRGYADANELLKDRELELAVIATPSHLHMEHTIAALGCGLHVVCEKPMAISTDQVDRMIAASKAANRLLAVFHNMRYWPDFAQVREVIASGVLGQIVQIKITMHRFTRRWDWQTLRQYGGGALFNAGAHLTDLGLQLFGPADPSIFVDLQRTLTSGDAEDHAKIILRADHSPTVEIEISNACAYPQHVWNVMGTAGGLCGTHEELDWKWIDVADLPSRPVDASPAAADRKFNRENLNWRHRSWRRDSVENPDFPHFFKDFYQSMRHGAPLVIPAESVRRTISVLEQCRKLRPL